MELKLHRPQAACAGTGRPFTAGDALVSALVRTEGRLERRDYSAAAWEGPPENTLAWWRSTFPTSEAATASLAPADVLLDVLEELDGSEADASLRYLLALELVRRRVLRFSERGADDAAGVRPGPAAGAAPRDLVLVCRRRDREYRVRPVAAAEVASSGVETRLTALLWSGGAA